MATSIDDFRLAKSDLRSLGKDLSRPECVIAERDGTLWVSDDRGGATRIDPDGRQSVVGAIPGLPNGLAMERDGSLLVAEIGRGTLHRLHRDGRSELLLDSFDGLPLGAANFVYIDPQGRTWFTISTRLSPRTAAIETPTPDGSVLRLDDDGPRLAAAGIHFTNEVRVDRDGQYLYVVESALGRVLRLPLAADGSLGAPAVYGPPRLFPGALLDGFAFDAGGNLWLTEISRNGIHVILPDGRSHCVFEDPSGEALLFPTSIAFGGADLRTAYVGSLKMRRLTVFRAPIPGEKLAHWD